MGLTITDHGDPDVILIYRSENQGSEMLSG